MLNSLEQELIKSLPLDGVALALHGSMAAEDQEDCEGEIIERVSKCIPSDKPIGVSLDLHAHVTPHLLKPNTFLQDTEPTRIQTCSKLDNKQHEF